MTIRHALAAAAAGCLLILTACAPTPEPTAADAPVPRAGDCLAGSAETTAGEVVPDHATITPCTEPHRYAVIGAIPVPADLLAGETAEELLQNRAALLDAGTAAEQYDAWAGTACETALADTVGLGSQSIDDVDAATARLLPAGAFTLASSLTDEPHWAAGTRSLVCTVRWVEPEDASTSRQLSLPAGVHLAELYSTEFPVEARQCLLHGDDGSELSDCTRPHSLEPFLTFDAGAVYGAEWVAAIDPDQITLQQYRTMDATCQGFARLALGDENAAVTARAGLLDAAGPEQGVFCALASAEFGRYDVEGSLIGLGAAEPQLVGAR